MWRVRPGYSPGRTVSRRKRPFASVYWWPRPPVPELSYSPSPSACQKSTSARRRGRQLGESTRPVTSSARPFVLPRRLRRRGEPGMKYGPSVCSGVSSPSSQVGVLASGAATFSSPHATSAIGSASPSSISRRRVRSSMRRNLRPLPESGLRYRGRHGRHPTARPPGAAERALPRRPRRGRRDPQGEREPRRGHLLLRRDRPRAARGRPAPRQRRRRLAAVLGRHAARGARRLRRRDAARGRHLDRRRGRRRARARRGRPRLPRHARRRQAGAGRLPRGAAALRARHGRERGRARHAPQASPSATASCSRRSPGRPS